MPVLADAHERHIDNLTRYQVADLVAFLNNVLGITGNEMELARMDAIDDSLFQVLSKARWMRVVDTNIFVQVEKGDLRPINISILSKRFEKLKLRCASRHYEKSLSAFVDCLLD